MWRVFITASAAYDHYWCVNAINCTGKTAPQNLEAALRTADANHNLCTEDHRPGEKSLRLFNMI